MFALTAIQNITEIIKNTCCRETVYPSANSKWNVFQVEKKGQYPTGIYLLKIRNGCVKIMNDFYSKVAIETPKRRCWQLYRQLWTDFTHCSVVFITDFEQVSAGWVAMWVIPICCPWFELKPLSHICQFYWHWPCFISGFDTFWSKFTC